MLLDVIKLRAFTIGPQITALFDEGSPDYLNRVIALISPYAPSDSRVFHSGMVTSRWATAVLAVPYTEEIGRSVVDAVLQIASIKSLQPYIPVGVWALLGEQEELQHVSFARFENLETSKFSRHICLLSGRSDMPSIPMASPTCAFQLRRTSVGLGWAATGKIL